MSRSEQEDYRGDVVYEVWRRGGDVDRVDYDRVADHCSYGDDYEVAADHEMRLQKPQDPEPDYWPL